MRRNALLFRLPAVLAFFESTNRTSDKGKKKKNAKTPGAGLHYGKSNAHASCFWQKRCGCSVLLKGAPRRAGAERPGDL